MARKKKFKVPAPVAYSNEPIMTTAQLAEYYVTTVDIITQNFRRNQDRFEEGKHYFKLEGETLKNFICNLQNEGHNFQVSSMTRVLYLWTRRGAARHAKMLNTEKAWEIFEKLEEFYFDNEKFSWNKTRADGKLVRRNFTDVIKEFAAYAKAQGTSRPECVFYSYYSKLCNKLAGLPNKKGRDGATIQQLGFCSWIEDRMAEIFDSGMKKILPYKEIEGYVKTWAENLATIIKMPLAIAAAKN